MFGDGPNSAAVLKLLIQHGADVSATDRKASDIGYWKANLITIIVAPLCILTHY